MPSSSKKNTSSQSKKEATKGSKAAASKSAASKAAPSKPTKPAPPRADISAVLEEPGAGAPMFPPTDAQSADNIGVLGTVGGAPPPDEELMVEVELAPGTDDMVAALASNAASIFGAAGDAASPADSRFGAVMNRYGLLEARSVFTPEQVALDEAHTQNLRAAAALGAAPPEQVSALERLPKLTRFVRLRFPPGTPASEVTEALKRLPEVARAVVVPRAAPPALLLEALSLVARAILAAVGPAPADPLVGSGAITSDPATGLESQWYLHRTRVPQAWRFARGANVVLADIDWGFRTSHQEFAQAIELTYNAFDGTTDVTHGGSASHGTAVLGIAGARSDGKGIAGYAPEAALWAIQGDSGTKPRAFQEPWAEAIDYVRRTDAGGRRKVIILEVQTGRPFLGNYEQVPSVQRAIRAAIADGCVVCVAAGNGNRPADRTDAGDPFDPTGSILVGATDFDPKQNKRAWFSNYGSRVVVSAPGAQSHDVTCGQSADNAYVNKFGGTSGATPKVAGAVALMLSVNPSLTHDDIRDILAGTGSSIVEDPGKPIGVFLNAEAAVAEALRRRGESLPSEGIPATPGQPATEQPVPNSLHGIRRRVGQMVLPQETETEGPISWDAVPEDDETSAAEAEATAAIPPGEQPPPGDKTLRAFRENVEGTLTQQDRTLIVAQAIEMLDNFYVHRPLKEAIHAVRPIQRLRVLQRRLQREADIPAGEQVELAFHNTLTQIFNSVRDLHTSYQLPRPYRDYIVYLPFEVASFYENAQRRYIVTRVVPNYNFASPDFGPGAELLYWNGMSIERAVLANADQTAGSNDAARHARGVSALTIRPMNTVLPPDADLVDLEFVPRGADVNDPTTRRIMRQHWFCRYAPKVGGDSPAASSPAAATVPESAPAPAAQPITFAAQSSIDFGRESTARSSDLLFTEPPQAAPQAAVPAAPPVPLAEPSARMRDLSLAATMGVDIAADAVREARQLIFESSALKEAANANIGDEVYAQLSSSSPGTVDDTVTGTEIAVRVPWNVAFRCRTVNLNGSTYGHIQIRTFHVPDADGFVQEFIRLLALVPEEGLILDVRGNGGGSIWAAERLLQTLAPAEIEPELMQFIVTPGTLDLARNNAENTQIPLDRWLPSLEGAVETGSIYSHAFPLTTKDSCNSIGQKYYGPVVLIIDGNCYSATDIFTAGFQDHNIGKILGVSNNTGAGGANVWEHWLLSETVPPGRLKPLPNQANMRVAIRQCLRVGLHSGALLEDFGVKPDDVHEPSREDVMEGDRMLFARAAKFLAEQPMRSIKVNDLGVSPADPTKRQLEIKMRGLKRLDFYLDDRPTDSIDLKVDASGASTLAPSIRSGVTLRLLGYVDPSDEQARKNGEDARTPRAVYRGRVP